MDAIADDAIALNQISVLPTSVKTNRDEIDQDTIHIRYKRNLRLNEF